MAEEQPIIPDLPPAPLRSEPEEVFSEKASAFVGAMNPWGQVVNDVAAWIRDKWQDIIESVPITLNARDQAVSAANTANAAADMAVSVVGAQEWDPAQEYVIGDAVWSPEDFQTYRRRTNGTSPGDPSTDPANWARVESSTATVPLAKLHANALSFY